MADTNDTPSVPETKEQKGAAPGASVPAPTVESFFSECEGHLSAGLQHELTSNTALQSRDGEFHQLVVKTVVMVEALGGIDDALMTGVIANRLDDLGIDTGDKKVKRRWRFVFDGISNRNPDDGTDDDKKNASEKFTRMAAAAECLARTYLADEDGKVDGRVLTLDDKSVADMVKHVEGQGGIAGLYSQQRQYERKTDDGPGDKKSPEETLLEASEKHYQTVDPIGEATADIKVPAHDLVVTISRPEGTDKDGKLKLAILDVIDDQAVINTALLHAKADCKHHLPIVLAMQEMSYVCEINVSRDSEYQTVEGDNKTCELVMAFCHDNRGHATGKMMLNRTMDCVVIHAALKGGLGVKVLHDGGRMPITHDLYVYTTQLKAFMAGDMKGLREPLILSGFTGAYEKPLDTHTSRIVLKSKTPGVTSKTISFHDLVSNEAVNEFDLADVEGTYKRAFEATITRDDLAKFHGKEGMGVWLKGRRQKKRKVIKLVFTPKMWTTKWDDAEPIEVPVEATIVGGDQSIELRVFGEDVWRFGEQVLSHLDLEGDITVRGTKGILEFRFSTALADYSVFIPEADEAGASRSQRGIRELDLSRGSAGAVRQSQREAA